MSKNGKSEFFLLLSLCVLIDHDSIGGERIEYK